MTHLYLIMMVMPKNIDSALSERISKIVVYGT
jgi:hypothetical protein